MSSASSDSASLRTAFLRHFSIMRLLWSPAWMRSTNTVSALISRGPSPCDSATARTSSALCTVASESTLLTNDSAEEERLSVAHDPLRAAVARLVSRPGLVGGQQDSIGRRPPAGGRVEDPPRAQAQLELAHRDPLAE